MVNQPMTLDQIQMQLQQRAGEQRGFADRLRDERQAFTQNAQQFTAASTPENQFQTEGGIPLQPSAVMNLNQALTRAVGERASGFSPQVEMQAREQETNLLNQIAQLAAARQPGAESVDSLLSKDEALTGLSDEQRKALWEERKNRSDANMDTSDIDALLGLAGEIDPKRIASAKNIIDKIDNILLDRDLGPLTGKVALRGGLRPGKRSEARETLALIDQILGDITVDERGRLKGQGTITDREQDTLAAAATTLQALKEEVSIGQVSESFVREELQRLKDDVFVSRAGGYTGRQQTDQPTPQPSRIDTTSLTNKYWEINE